MYRADGGSYWGGIVPWQFVPLGPSGPAPDWALEMFKVTEKFVRNAY